MARAQRGMGSMPKAGKGTAKTYIGEQTSRAPPLMPTDLVPLSCDLGDTNFQYPEVPWYPDPPALDL